MTAAVQAIGEAVDEVTRLRARLARNQTGQVRNQTEIDAVTAITAAWFTRHQSKCGPGLGAPLEKVNAAYTALVEKSARASARAGYLTLLRRLRADLIALRTQILATGSAGQPSPLGAAPPDFSSVAADAMMQAILTRRWQEAQLCIGAGANLAAVVMMGGLLEGLLLARVNQLTDQSPVFTSTSAPRDGAGKTLKLRDWGLNDYINVARELKWIGESAKDVSVVLRDYRNYIHPSRELALQLNLTSGDTAIMWTVFVTLTDQVLKNAAARTRP